MIRKSLGLVLAVAFACLACAPNDERPSLQVYSGRSESLVGPLLERFGEQAGIDVQVRYGGTAEMLATLLEEGQHSPADVFIAQDGAALGALAAAGRLARLDNGVLQRVPESFRAENGEWVGLSGRARVIVYNTERIRPEELPQHIDDITDSKYRGRFGFAPTNASFQAHMALYSAVQGEAALQNLLTAMQQNEPLRYPKNTPIVEAVINGEIDWGLVNHYYLWRALQQNPDAPARNYFLPNGDASTFINVAGAAILEGNDSAESAAALLRFLVSDEAQTYFAEETFEYPLVDGIASPVGLPSLDAFASRRVNYQSVAAALEGTLAQIRESGLMEF